MIHVTRNTLEGFMQQHEFCVRVKGERGGQANAEGGLARPVYGSPCDCATECVDHDTQLAIEFDQQTRKAATKERTRRAALRECTGSDRTGGRSINPQSQRPISKAYRSQKARALKRKAAAIAWLEKDGSSGSPRQRRLP